MYNKTIFREYDIRGVVGKDFNEEFARRLGRAFARVIVTFGGKTVSVGRDCRVSSPELSAALIKGITESGVNVLDVGTVTTPMLYFSLFELPVDGGIQVSGSHNPPDQNGFKVCIGKETLYGEGIQRLREIIEKADFPSGSGTVTEHPIRDAYVSWIASHIKLVRPLKVVTDSGNGTAGPVAPDILRKLGCEVIDLYSEMDGRFPNHHPDPTVAENLQDLIAKVKETGADLGIGYDGDADRIGAVTDQGEIIWGDILLIFLSRALLEEVPGSTVIGEVKCSYRLFNDIAARGGKPLMWKAGHSLIKAKMKETGALLGGEMSGHIFYKHRYFGYDDAVYTGCRLLELLAKSNRKLSELFAEIPATASTPEIRINCSDERKFSIVSQLRDYFASQGYETVDVDGVRLIFPDGWGLVRASNTQPMLSMRFEAENETRLNEIRKLMEDKVNELNK